MGYKGVFLFLQIWVIESLLPTLSPVAVPTVPTKAPITLSPTAAPTPPTVISLSPTTAAYAASVVSKVATLSADGKSLTDVVTWANGTVTTTVVNIASAAVGTVFQLANGHFSVSLRLSSASSLLSSLLFSFLFFLSSFCCDNIFSH